MRIAVIGLNSTSFHLDENEDVIMKWVDIWQDYFPNWSFSLLSISARPGDIVVTADEVLSARNALKNYDGVITIGDVVHKNLTGCCRNLINVPYQTEHNNLAARDAEVSPILKVLGFLDFINIGAHDAPKSFVAGNVSPMFGTVSPRKN